MQQEVIGLSKCHGQNNHKRDQQAIASAHLSAKKELDHRILVFHIFLEIEFSNFETLSVSVFFQKRNLL